MSVTYKPGSIVWAKLGQNWWPGRVVALEECPYEYTNNLTKSPLAIVKFFNESGLHEVYKEDFICSYHCSRKDQFIRKVLKSVQNDDELRAKFESDITMAEKLTGGNMNIIKEVKESGDTSKKKVDYADLGFGVAKPKKSTSKDKVSQKKGFSIIDEAIQYKRGLSPATIGIIEYKSKILEQPIRQKSIEEEMRTCGNFTCFICGYTCSRVDVMVWHNKGHMNKVVDYGAGLTLPRKRKRKSKQNSKVSETNKHPTSLPMVNGHASPTEKAMNTSELLQDWDDEEDGVCENEMSVDETAKDTLSITNGTNSHPSRLEESDDSDSDDSDLDYHRVGGANNKPMPPQIDINSAFDALLAETSIIHSPSNHSQSTKRYVNNGSDSDDSSDWGKYYNRDTSSDSEIEDSKSKGKVRSRKSSKSYSPKRFSKDRSRSKSMDSDENLDKKRENSHVKHSENKSRSLIHADKSPKKSDSKSHSSNSSTSSGPAYMLVAVDAQGNNIPMPVLNEGGSHMVAVEASMEDGSTRTLYIDPAHLGPNVDLNNLMLHIDNSGQETVIIPTSSAQDTDSIQSTTSNSSIIPDSPSNEGKEEPED